MGIRDSIHVRNIPHLDPKLSLNLIKLGNTFFTLYYIFLILCICYKLTQTDWFLNIIKMFCLEILRELVLTCFPFCVVLLCLQMLFISWNMEVELQILEFHKSQIDFHPLQMSTKHWFVVKKQFNEVWPKWNQKNNTHLSGFALSEAEIIKGCHPKSYVPSELTSSIGDGDTAMKPL